MRKTLKIVSITAGVFFLLAAFLPVCLAEDGDGQPDMPPARHGGFWEKRITQWQDLYKTSIVLWNGAGWYTVWIVTRIPIQWEWMWIPDNMNDQTAIG
jgi:hypothetical protein